MQVAMNFDAKTADVLIENEEICPQTITDALESAGFGGGITG